MNLHLEPYQLIMLLFTIAGSFWGFGKAFFARIEHSIRERDDNLAQNIHDLMLKVEKESETVRQLDREILKLKADLSKEFVAKEDFIRSFTVVEAKIDALQTTLNHLGKSK